MSADEEERKPDPAPGSEISREGEKSEASRPPYRMISHVRQVNFRKRARGKDGKRYPKGYELPPNPPGCDPSSRGRRPGSKNRRPPRSFAWETRKAKLRQLKEIQAKKDELTRLQSQLKYRKTHAAIRWYQVKPDFSSRGPNPLQDRFHRSKAKVRVISAANRVGKSVAGTNEAVAHALGYRPWLAQEDPDRKVDVPIPNKGLVIGESFGEQVKKVLVPKLLGDPERGLPGAIPTHELKQVKKNQQGIINEIYLNNGSQIYLQSYDQDIDLFESAAYSWAWFDEPPPRPIWVGIQRGMTDTCGPSWLTMTPLKEPWIYDEIFQREDCQVFYGAIEDNLGYGLTQEGIDQFARNLNPDEMEARLKGRYFHLVGLVYKAYANDVHRIPRFPIPRHWSIYFHADTHPRTPHHAVWLAVNAKGQKYVCGELKNRDANNDIYSFIEAVKVYERTMFMRSCDEFVRLIEPGSQAPDPMRDGKSIWDVFYDAGLDCKPGSKDLQSGILLMQNEIRHEPQKGIFPTLFFFDDLEGVHHELTHYVWDDWAKRTAQGRTEKQKPKDKDDHYIEGIHRILLEDPVCESALVREADVAQARQPIFSGSSVTGY